MFPSFHSQSPLGELQSKSLTFLKATTVDRVTGALGGMSSVGDVSPSLQLPPSPCLPCLLATSVPGQAGSFLSLCPSSMVKGSDTPRGETEAEVTSSHEIQRICPGRGKFTPTLIFLNCEMAPQANNYVMLFGVMIDY